MSKLPAFTAEASLGKTSTQYRTQFNRATGVIGDSAQFILTQNWFGDLGRFIGRTLWGVGELAVEGIECAAATGHVAASCTAGIAETGDVGMCATAISEWSDSCIK